MIVVKLVRPLLVTAVLGAALCVAPGCTKSSDDPTSAAHVDQTTDAVTEENDSGSVTWSVAPSGQVTALVKSTDGKPLVKGVSGQLVWKGPAGATTVPLSADEKAGTLVASGPKLDDDLTEIAYSLSVDGKPWTGTLQIPRGGTQALADGAKEVAASPVPAGKTGPNGGVIQVVGKDRVEIVADKSSGQVRVYVLGPDFQVAPIGERRVRLGVGGEGSEIVILTPEPKGLYFTGKLTAKTDPTRLTIVISEKDQAHACIVGWTPGLHLLVGARAPRVRILVATFGADVDIRVQAGQPQPSTVVILRGGDDDDDHDHGKHKGEGKHHGRGR